MGDEFIVDYGCDVVMVGIYTPYRLITCMKRQTTMLCAEVVTSLARTESSHRLDAGTLERCRGKIYPLLKLWLWFVKTCLLQLCSQPCFGHMIPVFVFSIFYIQFIYEVYHGICLCLDLKVGTMELSPV